MQRPDVGNDDGTPYLFTHLSIPWILRQRSLPVPKVRPVPRNSYATAQSSHHDVSPGFSRSV